MSQFVQTVNRLEPSWPNFQHTLNNQLSLTYDVAAPGTAYQDKSYGMAGLGNAFDDSISAFLPASISPYFTSENYYVGFIGLGALLLLLTGKGLSGRKQRAATTRRARIKGAIAANQELLKS